jgi:hypothetical protein
MRTYSSIQIKVFVFYLLLIGLLFSIVKPVYSGEAKSPCQVITFMPDFYAFWERTKDQPLEKRITLWDELFEAKHSDFYREVIYADKEGNALKQSKEQKLQNFLSSLTDKHIQRMKAKEQELTKQIPLVADKIAKVLSSTEEGITHFIIPSLNVTSGAGATYKSDLIIFYGIEFMIQYDDPEYIQEMIAHQILHVIHYRKIAPVLWKKYGTKGDLNVLLDREGPLFFIYREGLAISFAESLFPGGDRPGILEKNVPVFKANFLDYTKKFLQDLRNFTPEVYENYFSGIQTNSEPPGFGFFLGYQIVKSLLHEYPLEQLLQWSPERAVQAVWIETKKILDK